MAGLKFKKSLNGHNTGALERFIVTNSVTVTKGDPVNLAAGYLDLAGAGEAILGVANETVVGDGTKTCEIILADGAVFEITADNTSVTTAQAHMGTYHDVTGTTGAIVLDSDSTTTATAQLLALKLNGAVVDVVVNELQAKL